MAITRKLLRDMGLTEEQVDTIIEAHTETVDGLKEQIKEQKATSEKLASVEAELEKAQETIKNSKNDNWQVKYDALKEEYDSYKTEQETKETKAAKETAYKALMKSLGISEKVIAKATQLADLSEIELEDGKIKDSEALSKALKEEWADFIVSTETKGAKVSTPSSNNGGGAMTKEQISQIKDRAERQAAIAANMNLYTKGE